MNWFLRFCIGLPARPADVAEIQRDVPELLDANRRARDFDWPRVVLPILFVRRPEHAIEDPRELAAAVRTWVSEVSRAVAVDLPAREAGGQCEHPSCPRSLAGESRTPRTQPSEPSASETRGTDVPTIQHLMVVGGGPGQKPLLQRFLDLVRRVHAEAGEATKVVVTDPYLLTESSERGTGGGFANFCEYLRAIRLASGAVLFIPPGPKKPSANRVRWIESVRREFRGLEVASFASGLSFHDRFYIVEHDAGAVRGVFGPSMNGLSDTDIALFGELEVSNALSTLSTWFDLKSPSAKKTKPKKGRPRN